jgi:hypothetical protein
LFVLLCPELKQMERTQSPIGTFQSINNGVDGVVSRDESQMQHLLIEQLKAAAELSGRISAISNQVLNTEAARTQSLAAECRSCAFQLAFVVEGVKIDL